MIDAQQMQLIKSQVSLRPNSPIPKRNQPLINAQGLKDAENSGIYGDAGMLSGEVNESLNGNSTGKRGVVSKALYGNWSDITGSIDGFIGNATSVSGSGGGKSGNLSGFYGNFENWIGDVSGLKGDVSGYGGIATGINVTMDEIRSVLKESGSQVP